MTMVSKGTALHHQASSQNQQ